MEDMLLKMIYTLFENKCNELKQIQDYWEFKQ